MSFMTASTWTINADTKALGANIDLFLFKKLKNSIQYDADGMKYLVTIE